MIQAFVIFHGSVIILLSKKHTHGYLGNISSISCSSICYQGRTLRISYPQGKEVGLCEADTHALINKTTKPLIKWLHYYYQARVQLHFQKCLHRVLTYEQQLRVLQQFFYPYQETY